MGAWHKITDDYAVFSPLNDSFHINLPSISRKYRKGTFKEFKQEYPFPGRNVRGRYKTKKASF